MAGLFFETNFKGNSIYDLIDGVVIDIAAGAAGVNGDPSDPSTSYGGAPVLSFGGLVYFNGWTSGGSDNLMVYNPITALTTDLKLPASKVWGQGLGPQDFTTYDSKVYFVGENASGRRTLWTTNGKVGGTHKVAGSPVDHGQMASYGGGLFFNATVSGKKDLEEFTSSGFRAAPGVTKGLNPQDLIAVDLDNGGSEFDDLFFNGTNAAGVQSLFDYDGVTLTQVDAKGLDPEDMTTSNDGVFTSMLFNGMDDTGSVGGGIDNETTGRGLYLVQNIGGGLSGAYSNLIGPGIDPQDITNYDNEAFFAAVDGNTKDPGAEGLWVYNRADNIVDNGVSEILSSSDYNLDMNESLLGTLSHPQAQIGATGGLIYFDATTADATQAMFTYNPLTKAVSGPISGTSGALAFDLKGV